MTRRHYGFGCPPKKGTKQRAFLLAALRPQGVTYAEATEILGVPGDWPMPKKSCRVSAVATTLGDQKGYDLRTFRNGGLEGPHAYPLKSFRLVGKMRWDGSYRSFIHYATASDLASAIPVRSEVMA